MKVWRTRNGDRLRRLFTSLLIYFLFVYSEHHNFLGESRITILIEVKLEPVSLLYRRNLWFKNCERRRDYSQNLSDFREWTELFMFMFLYLLRNQRKGTSTPKRRY